MEIDYQPSVNLDRRAASPSRATGLTSPSASTETHPEKPCTCIGCSNKLYGDSDHERPAHGFLDGKHFLRLKAFGHEPLSLALPVAATFQRGLQGPTQEQITASRKWRKLWPQFEHELSGGHQSNTSAKLQTKARRILNEIFFCNTLKRVDIVWDLEICEASPGRSSELSSEGTSDEISEADYWIRMCEPGRMGKVNRHTKITLKPELRGEHLIGTLLYKMVHAFFQQYACDKANCKCQDLYDQNLRDDGHGRAFLWLATAIQKSSKAFLGSRADLHSA